jgi:hypothetical protein
MSSSAPSEPNRLSPRTVANPRRLRLTTVLDRVPAPGAASERVLDDGDAHRTAAR